MAHCRCSFRESSGGLPLEKLALSMSGESDLQRLAGSKESRVKEDSGEGGPGACWSILNVPAALCLFFSFRPLVFTYICLLVCVLLPSPFCPLPVHKLWEMMVLCGFDTMVKHLVHVVQPLHCTP